MTSEKERIKNELRAKKRLFVEILRNLRTPIYNGVAKNTSYLLYFEEANLDGAPYSMPFIILPTRPCSWLRKSSGCFECGYSNLSNKDTVDEKILNLFDKCLRSLKNIPHQMVAIGTSGSFLDPQELSENVQNEILRMVSSLPDIKIIGIESRPEFITSKRIREICEIVYPKRIMLGMGLESSNDFIREYCINKGLTTTSYLRALKIIKQYDNISPLAYVLLGKPFLPRSIDIADTISSINFAATEGFDRVVLMATSLRENTLTKLLYEVREYIPPSSRMIIEVLKQLKPEIRSKVIIANPCLPKPVFVNQCPVCSEFLEQLIILYKYTANYNYIRLADEVDFNCKCKGNIENITMMEYDEISLGQIILESYKKALRKLEGDKNARD